MRKYLLHVLIISFVFLLAPTAHVVSYAGAIEDAKEEVRNNPDDARAHYNLACCYSLLGNVNKALESLGRAIDLGFDDIKHIENDSDLDGLRDEADYKKLINKLKR